MNDLLEKCFVINLINREDKLNHFTKELKKEFPITYCKLNAILGIQPDIIKKFELNFNTDKLNKGEIGCFCSHISILQYIVNNNIPWTTIFEDDVIFCKNFKKKFKLVLNQLQGNNAGLIYLGGRTTTESLEENFLEMVINRPSPYYEKPVYKIHLYLLESSELIFMGAFSYCISLESAKLILKCAKMKIINKPFDLFMTIAHHHNNKNMLYCNPMLTYAKDDFISDISKYGDRYV